jgi:hypothetical protein
MLLDFRTLTLVARPLTPEQGLQILSAITSFASGYPWEAAQVFCRMPSPGLHCRWNSRQKPRIVPTTDPVSIRWESSERSRQTQASVLRNKNPRMLPVIITEIARDNTLSSTSSSSRRGRRTLTYAKL